MLRGVLVVAACALGATAVLAQQDPIAARKALMKANGDQAKIGAAMAKGEAPFDLAKAQQVFATFSDSAGKEGGLFPENSKTGGDTAALPKIWETPDDFKAKLAKFGADTKAAQASVKDFDSFKAAFGTVGKDCGGCHESYRVKKT